ncbi:hypothetical protein DMC61_19790 [Amycolatopsis sp. WAC 04169]|nr:hypothetical protein DMC61_19790 [Amycolatopsis sp. WAC 04169]
MAHLTNPTIPPSTDHKGLNDMTETLNQAALFAALSVHINAHPDLAELASVSGSTLQISGTEGVTAAVAWAHTLGGDRTVTLGAHPHGDVGVKITGTMAGRRVTVFTVDDDRLHELLPPDVGQPYFQRQCTLTLADLEAHLDTAVPADETNAPEPEGTPGAQLAAALHVMFPEDFFAIAEADAYGALKHKVLTNCEINNTTPREVLEAIDPEDRAFAAKADDPAAFLASRIES